MPFLFFRPHLQAHPVPSVRKPHCGGALAAGGVQASTANFSVSKSWQEPVAAVSSQKPRVPPGQPVLNRGNVPIYFPEAGCAAERTRWQVASCHSDGDSLCSSRAVNLLIQGKNKRHGTGKPQPPLAMHSHPTQQLPSQPGVSPKHKPIPGGWVPWTMSEPPAQPSGDPDEDAESPAPIPPHPST